MKALSGILGLAAAALISTGASAQSFNVDLGTTVAGGGGIGAPSAAFGAASGQVGFWNDMSGTTTTNMLLSNLAGGATAVSFTRSSALGGNFAFNNAQTFGDTELLMDDGQDLSATTVPVLYTFAGLAAGQYTVYTYAAAPDFAAQDQTSVIVGGVQQISTGPIPAGGTFVQGQTHTIHNVNIAAGGSIVISADGINGGFGTVNGFQLVHVPAPGALALLGVAGLMSGRRRRA